MYARKYSTLKHKLGFIGMGKMGTPMSSKLYEKYNDLIVYDNNAASLIHFEGKLKIASGMNDFRDCDIVFTMLPDAKSTYMALFSDEGLTKSLKKGSIIVNCGTIGISESTNIMKNLGNNFEFVDAPVSGGIIGAENATLTFMIGGNKTSIDKITHILRIMGQKMIYLGDVGKGQAAKICNNLLLAINMVGASESFALAKQLDLDLKTFSDIVNSSSGRSWVTELNTPVPNVNDLSPSSRNYEGGFSSKLLLKDVNLALNASTEKNLKLNALESVQSIYSEMITKENESGFKDMSYIFQYISKNSKNKP